MELLKTALISSTSVVATAVFFDTPFDLGLFVAAASLSTGVCWIAQNLAEWVNRPSDAWFLANKVCPVCRQQFTLVEVERDEVTSAKHIGCKMCGSEFAILSDNEAIIVERMVDASARKR